MREILGAGLEYGLVPPQDEYGSVPAHGMLEGTYGWCAGVGSCEGEEVALQFSGVHRFGEATLFDSLTVSEISFSASSDDHTIKASITSSL